MRGKGNEYICTRGRKKENRKEYEERKRKENFIRKGKRGEGKI